MYLSKKSIAAALIAAAALGFSVQYLTPRKPDRPFLVFLAKAARTALWVMMFAESEEPCQKTLIVTSPGDEPVLDHARSL